MRIYYDVTIKGDPVELADLFKRARFEWTPDLNSADPGGVARISGETEDDARSYAALLVDDLAAEVHAVSPSTPSPERVGKAFLDYTGGAAATVAADEAARNRRN